MIACNNNSTNKKPQPAIMHEKNTHPHITPRDAATLIIIKKNNTTNPQKYQILMGRRNKKHAFMPDVFVFPGGKVDRSDSKIIPAHNLNPKVEEKLLIHMRGKKSKNKARAIAMAAVRETFEETGFKIGAQTANTIYKTPNATGWKNFCQNQIRPNLKPLTLIARAITPPGQIRRFDTRFFITDAKYIINLNNPEISGDELLETQWVTLKQAQSLKKHHITEKILTILTENLRKNAAIEKQKNIYFQYQKYQKWIYQNI